MLQSQTETVIRIPNDWEPRPYQRGLWNHLERGGKRAVAVWHRRAGKESVTLNWTAVAAMRRVGTYFHILPELKQGRKIVWDGVDSKGRRMIDQAFPPDLRESQHENEMRIRLKNGSVWQLVGSDDYDSIIGTNPVGIVFSEWAISNPQSWEYLRPILAENGGWALFIFTPRGQNHGADIYDMAKKTDGWFSEILTVENTTSIPPEAIEAERAAGMPEDMIAQEFYCSFQTGAAGAYYGKYFEEIEKAGRICRVPYEPTARTITAWDLGIDDATAIWCVQLVNSEIRVIDYIEDSGMGLEHYVKILDKKGYLYSDHLFPSDVRVRELGTGRSRYEILRGLGITGSVVPKLGVEEGIAAVRSILPRCWFDADKCARGIKGLRNYRVEYDPKAATFRSKPLHDWTSHPADAFRYLAIGLKGAEKRLKPRHPQRTRTNNSMKWLRRRR